MSIQKQKKRLEITFIIATFLSLSFSTQAGEQWLNLPDSATDRFEITDRIWPATAGEANICLWKDDALGAYSITIDDNCAPDLNWWVEQGNTFGFRFTWFVISGRPSQYNTGFNGIWDAADDPAYGRPSWNELQDTGHDIQSHTVTHLHYLEENREERDAESVTNIAAEYSIAIEHVETFITNHPCTMLAYPGGGNSHLNDEEVAALYYSGARSTSGAFNRANRTEYISTKSMAIDIDDTLDANGKLSRTSIHNLIDREHAYKNGIYYRAWGTQIFHGIPTEAARALVITNLTFIKDHEADIWFGLYGDVSRYGQERDSAVLTVVENTATQIRFTLSDDMLDTVFTFPLTIKVRLPNDWIGAKATQNGSTIEAALIEHEGGNYALVQAVPDQGEVLLKKGIQKGSVLILR